jgi:hypothetical protein
MIEDVWDMTNAGWRDTLGQAKHPVIFVRRIATTELVDGSDQI